MRRFSLGLDYGSLSGRAVLLDLQKGEILGVEAMDYPHGVMDHALFDATPLPPNWALQDANDYLIVLETVVPKLLKKTGVLPEEVVGIGVDFTASTVLPVDEKGRPLSENPRWRTHPHAYVKLWKHHAAQEDANRLNEIAKRRGEIFLKRYGGKISSEWMVPKVMQLVREAPEIYEAMDRWMEAADWIVLAMTGCECRNVSTAGYKGIWSKEEGYPSRDFFKALDPRLENFVEEKLSRTLYPLGHCAGGLREDMAQKLGLLPGTAVAVGNIDAHVSIPAVGITGPGTMLMIMGTSTCDILIDEKAYEVSGMCGMVEDGVLPGFFGYEAGQSCVGDGFDWFVKHLVPWELYREAEKREMTIHELLTERAGALRPGESGLLALDWMNGNRSVLVDTDLTGLLLGFTLKTKAHEIYRALLEATAFGTRKILETFREHGVLVHELVACGGIAAKNRLMMQIYADVTQMPIRISATDQAPALGAAMFGAVAAGKEKSGFDSIFSIAKAFGKVGETVLPRAEFASIYDALYEEYKRLHDYFGRGENDVMKRLKAFSGREGERE